MRCEEFLEHLHDRLDRRLPLGLDPTLEQHAANCEECWSEMRVWLEIGPLLESGHSGRAGVHITPSSNGYSVLPPMLMAVLAVAILISVVGISPTKSNSKPILRDGSASSGTLTQATAELDPLVWWQSVQDRDWVEETMPTVRSVRKGVAPLGRTLVRAVTILTIGAEGRAS